MVEVKLETVSSSKTLVTSRLHSIITQTTTEHIFIMKVVALWITVLCSLVYGTAQLCNPKTAIFILTHCYENPKPCIFL